jgi:glycosyltransferase involved in cell wall biosynthesis
MLEPEPFPHCVAKSPLITGEPKGTGQAPFRKYPKVLFVHDCRPDSVSSADLSRQLLRGYPPQRLAWWHCRYTALRAEPDLRADTVAGFHLPSWLIPSRRLNPLKSWLVERCWAPLAARHLQRMAAEIKPDVISVLLFGWSILVARRLKPLAGTRLHVSLWDFPDHASGRQTLGLARSQRIVQAMFQLVRRADSFDGISNAMLEEIAAQTGRTGGILVHSGFEAQHLQALEQSSTAASDDVIRVAFVGTIISREAFLRVLDILENIRPALPRKLVLEFFGGRNYQSQPWFRPEWMVEHGVFTDQGLVEAVQRCSWGIVVMDPEGTDLRYSRFSFPNKIGTYLSAGVPVLGLGHPQSSLAEVMHHHPVGVFSSARAPEELARVLGEALATERPRLRYREAILKCARSEFDAAAMRQRLWSLWGSA